MIVISNPVPIENEIKLIRALFAEGLMLFHVRKPDFSENDTKAFILEMGFEFRNRLVLHQHHQLAEDFGINRIHFTEKVRNETSHEMLNHWKGKGFTLSTSVHSIENFNTLENDFDYAFLGLVFPSISKENYVPSLDYTTELQKRTNHKTRLTALGGIQSGNINLVLTLGFDDIALLGTIWNQSNPIENFKQCQQIAPSYSL